MNADEQKVVTILYNQVQLLTDGHNKLKLANEGLIKTLECLQKHSELTNDRLDKLEMNSNSRLR